MTAIDGCPHLGIRLPSRAAPRLARRAVPSMRQPSQRGPSRGVDSMPFRFRQRRDSPNVGERATDRHPSRFEFNIRSLQPERFTASHPCRREQQPQRSEVIGGSLHEGTTIVWPPCCPSGPVLAWWACVLRDVLRDAFPRTSQSEGDISDLQEPRMRSVSTSSNGGNAPAWTGRTTRRSDLW